MTETVRFSSPDALADLGRYAGRARQLDEDGAMRLQADGLVLAAWVGVLPGSGILGEGAVLGLRTMALAEPAELDVTVPLRAVSDRAAYRPSGTTFAVPPTGALAPWAAIIPPRSGWELMGEVPADELAEVGESGVAEVTEAVAARGAAAGFAKAEVWSRLVTFHRDGARPDDAGIELRAGGALAAFGLGFLRPGSMVRVLRCRPWVRLTAPGGHVLMR